MFARLSAFLIWAFVAATVVFWALRLAVHPLEVPSQALAVGQAAGARGDLSRLLGSAPVVTAVAVAAPEASSRFKLIGVMAPKLRNQKAVGEKANGAYGLALIAVDGKPAKAYAVGSSVDSGLVLQSVGMRTASIVSRQGAPTLTLELPPLPEPATGRPGATSGPVPIVAGRSAQGGVPPNIATLPPSGTFQNPAMAGQPPNNGAPPMRQPAPVQDPSVPPPAQTTNSL